MNLANVSHGVDTKPRMNVIENFIAHKNIGFSHFLRESILKGTELRKGRSIKMKFGLKLKLPSIGNR